MDSFKILERKIQNREARICVVGLGYVGLPLAVSFAKVVIGSSPSPEQGNPPRFPLELWASKSPQTRAEVAGSAACPPTGVHVKGTFLQEIVAFGHAIDL